jgi:hypothetical protein
MNQRLPRDKNSCNSITVNGHRKVKLSIESCVPYKWHVNLCLCIGVKVCASVCAQERERDDLNVSAHVSVKFRTWMRRCVRVCDRRKRRLMLWYANTTRRVYWLLNSQFLKREELNLCSNVNIFVFVKFVTVCWLKSYFHFQMLSNKHRCAKIKQRFIYIFKSMKVYTDSCISNFHFVSTLCLLQSNSCFHGVGMTMTIKSY